MEDTYLDQEDLCIANPSSQLKLRKLLPGGPEAGDPCTQGGHHYTVVSLSNYSASGLDDFGSFDVFARTCDTFWIPIFNAGSGIASEALLNVVENKKGFRVAQYGLPVLRMFRPLGNTAGVAPTVGNLLIRIKENNYNKSGEMVVLLF
uniref:Uncharacterized protein n=1 Tax=Oryza punctata TaxID=4537 RepID=A0A0E0MMJ5_ORYPU